MDLGFETPTTSPEMRNGEYRAWSKKENERRSGRINDLLSRVRASVEPEVWRMVFEMGFGGVQVQDIALDEIGDKIQDEQRITVHKLPPDLNALQIWLRHHSQMYRNIESEESKDEENSGVLTNINHNISIDRWIEKRVSND